MENVAASETKPLPIPQSTGWRFFYAVVVTVLPVFCFIAISILKPEYQTGKFTDYVSLFLTTEASWVFFPFIAYSSISLLLLFITPERFAKSFWVRFGIYTGALLAFQYAVLMFLALMDEFYIVLVVWIVSLVIVPIYKFLTKLLGIRLVLLIFVVLPMLAYCFLFLIGSIFPETHIPFVGSEVTTPFFLLAAFVLICAPLWSFLIMGQTSYQLIKNYETRITLVRSIGVIAWLGGFIPAWRFAVLKALELYAALPPQPPDCYIATAAAKGHPAFVRSHEVQLKNGMSMRVNRQLQILKCAELTLLATAPRLYKTLRTVYDVIGKVIARRIQNPLFADVAYLLLKPFEWLAVFTLKLVIPNWKDFVSKMYTY